MQAENHFLGRIFKEEHFKNEERNLIFNQFREVRFSKGDFLIQEGKTANLYWFVASGFLRAYALDVEGNDISTQFYTVGDTVIDWSSFFLRQQSKENIQALTDCVCWELNFDQFQQLFHSIEAFREQGRANLVGSFFALKNHSLAMITDSAKDRYKRLLDEKPHLLQNVSLKQIASYLGVKDTSLSRIRKELAAE